MKIAIFGRMRSGKDTVGKIFIDDYGFKKYAFGTGIGEIIQKYFPEEWEKGKPRKHYQVIGQSLRSLDPDVWIKYLLNQIEKDGADRVIITDGRQLNEVEKLRQSGYSIIKVEAEESVRIKRILESGDTFKPELLNHETEIQVDDIVADYVIKNNGSLNKLYKEVFDVMVSIKENE